MEVNSRILLQGKLDAFLNHPYLSSSVVLLAFMSLYQCLVKVLHLFQVCYWRNTKVWKQWFAKSGKARTVVLWKNCTERLGLFRDFHSSWRRFNSQSEVITVITSLSSNCLRSMHGVQDNHNWVVLLRGEREMNGRS